MIMAKFEIRPLMANEIEVRVGTLKKDGSGASYLLYKDSRCDMKILDEVFGAFNWQREHKELKGVIYCGVSIRSEQGEWVTKWDAGAESNVEKEKGEASDSFKRACTNWGIGRELYTSPKIWINFANDDERNARGNIDLKVSNINIVEGKIVALEIVDKRGNVRYTMGKQVLPNKPVELKEKPAPSAKKVTAPAETVITIEEFRDKWYGTEYTITNDDCADAAKAWGLCSTPRTMPVDMVVDMVLNHAKIKGCQGIEEERQALIVSIESADSEKELKVLYNAYIEIVDEYIRSKFTARKNQIKQQINQQTA